MKYFKIKNEGIHRVVILLIILSIPIVHEIAWYFENYIMEYPNVPSGYDFHIPKLYVKFFEYLKSFFNEPQIPLLNKLIGILLTFLLPFITYVFVSIVIKVINWILTGFKND